MKNVFLACVLFLIPGCMTSEHEARETLADEGLTDVTVGGWVPFSGCPEDQNRNSSFTAHRGDRAVSGVVCCNLFACSVRYH